MASMNAIGNKVTSGNFTVTAGNILLPTTSATVGQITLNSYRFLHCYNSDTNTFLGRESGVISGSGGTYNVGIGMNTLNSINNGGTATHNIAVGYNAGWGVAKNGSSGCNYNTIVGDNAGSSQYFDGAYNVILGASALSSAGATAYNVSIGYNSGSNLLNAHDNIFISNAGANANNRIYIGTEGSGNGQQNITYIAGIYGYAGTIGTTGTAAVIIDSAGQLQSAHAYSADANCKTVSLIKSRGTSASPTVITANDALGIIDFRGHDGTGYIVGSQITSTNSGTVATNRVASDLKFYTHPDSTTASTLRLTIDSIGQHTIAAPDSGTALTITNGGLTITAGTITFTPMNAAGVVVNDASGVITTIAKLPPSKGGNLPVTENTASNTVAMVADNAYIATSTDGATLVVYTLPSTAAVGTLMEVTGKSTAYWEIDQNASQTIHMGTTSTTTGVTGKVTTAHQWASVTLRCITANTDWVIISNTGTVTLA